VFGVRAHRAAMYIHCLHASPTAGTRGMTTTRPLEDEQPFRHPGIRWEEPREGATTAVFLGPQGLAAMRAYLKNKHQRNISSGPPDSTSD
jgi:hypothetical protein